MDRVKSRLSSADRALHLLGGAADGSVIPFALVTALARGGSSTVNVVLMGAMASVLGAALLGIVYYLTARSITPAAKASHDHEEMLRKIGFTDEQLAAVKAESAEDAATWQGLQEQYNLHELLPNVRRAIAATSGLGFLIAGLGVVSPYAFATRPAEGVLPSVIIAACMWLVCGAAKASLTGRPIWIGALRLIVLGATIGVAVYFGAGLFL